MIGVWLYSAPSSRAFDPVPSFLIFIDPVKIFYRIAETSRPSRIFRLPIGLLIFFNIFP